MTDAIEEMEALEFEWLLFTERDNLPLGLSGHRDTIDPVNPVRVKHKFLIGLGIIEDRHLAVAHQYKLLLFKRM
jgi:hypothetical protein